VLSSIPDVSGSRSGAGPVFPDVSGTHTGRVRYYWQYSVQQPFLLRFVRLSFVLRSICCVGLLSFHKPYLGALVTGWLGYLRCETLLLFYRSGCLLVRYALFLRSTCFVVIRCVPREHAPFSRVVVITVFVFASWDLSLGQRPNISKEIWGSHSPLLWSSFPVLQSPLLFSLKNSRAILTQKAWSTNINMSMMFIKWSPNGTASLWIMWAHAFLIKFAICMHVCGAGYSWMLDCNKCIRRQLIWSAKCKQWSASVEGHRKRKAKS
jgi:hypothetical protein